MTNISSDRSPLLSLSQPITPRLNISMPGMFWCPCNWNVLVFGLFPHALVLSSGSYWLPFCREVKTETLSLLLKAKCPLLSYKLLHGLRHNEFIHIPVQIWWPDLLAPIPVPLPLSLYPSPSQGAAPPSLGHLTGTLLLTLCFHGGACWSPRKRNPCPFWKGMGLLGADLCPPTPNLYVEVLSPGTLCTGSLKFPP